MAPCNSNHGLFHPRLILPKVHIRFLHPSTYVWGEVPHSQRWKTFLPHAPCYPASKMCSATLLQDILLQDTFLCEIPKQEYLGKARTDS